MLEPRRRGRAREIGGARSYVKSRIAAKREKAELETLLEE